MAERDADVDTFLAVVRREIARQEPSPDRQRLFELAANFARYIRRCETLGVDPAALLNGDVATITTGMTGFSEVRLMIDHETEERSWWTEAHFDGEVIRLTDGDLVVCRRPV